jgi:DNA-binding NarL/FixJ family response regulator
MLERINVLIADNQILTREGVAAVLSLVNDIHIIGSASNPDELGRLITAFNPDVIIMDYHFAHNFKILDLNKTQSQVNIQQLLILSNGQQKSEILKIINLGIKNHLFKDCSGEELILAVYAVAKGEDFFCQGTIHALLENELALTTNNLPLLSPRETEIVHLIADGLANKEIAEKLFLSIHTIKTHRKNIIKKLGFTFKNAAGLASISKLLQ